MVPRALDSSWSWTRTESSRLCVFPHSSLWIHESLEWIHYVWSSWRRRHLLWLSEHRFFIFLFFDPLPLAFLPLKYLFTFIFWWAVHAIGQKKKQKKKKENKKTSTRNGNLKTFKKKLSTCFGYVCYNNLGLFAAMLEREDMVGIYTG